MIKIYSKDNKIRCTASTANGRQEKQLQGDNTLSLSFTLYEYIRLDVNDYAIFQGERYWLLERYKPRMKNTKEWEYNLTLYGIESLVKRFLVINYTDNEDTPVFTLTAPAAEHARLILTSINKAIGKELFKLGEVKQTENIVIDYKGTYCNEALDLLAKAAKTEFWFENGTTLNISRAQYGEPLTLGYQKGLTTLEREKADNIKFYTRLFPLGSTKNIDRDKYGHTRLQLPNGQKYVDKDVETYGIVHHFEEAAFANIYPRRIGVVSAVRSEERKNKEGKPFTVYYFKDKDLNFNPNDYKIGGYVMRVAFQEGSELAGQGTSEEHYFEVNYDDTAKVFEIITIFPNDTMQVPGGVLVPKVGDKYILYHLRMPDEYYPLAEQELLEAVKKFNEENFIDNSVYKADTDHVWVERQQADFFLGRRIRLESAEYFAPKGYRNSRITKITRSIALPTQISLEISDVVPKGKIASMEGSINDVRHYIGEVTNTIPDIIGSGDDTKAGEHNVFSAKRALKEFLNKNTPDTAQKLITFLEGIALTGGKGIDAEGRAKLLEVLVETIRSYDFDATTETGFGITRRKDGKYQLSITDLIVWGKAVFNELEMRKLSYVGGNMVFSSCGSKIMRVEELADAYRCYFYMDDGTTATTNLWEDGDQVRCQTFNIASGKYEGVSNKQYWRKVTQVGTDFIDLSKTDCAENSDAPEAGDTIVQFGSRTNIDRMALIYVIVSGDEAPAIIWYDGVNSYTLDKRCMAIISPRQVVFSTKMYKLMNYDGTIVPMELHLGAWEDGKEYYYYNSVTHGGRRWLCVAVEGKAVTSEPKDGNPDWLLQVDKGEKGGTGWRIEGFSSPGSGAYSEWQTDWSAVYSLHVWYDDAEVTDRLPSTRFVWSRQSEYAEADTAWNKNHANIGSELHVTYDDLYGDTSFICRFLDEAGRKSIKSVKF